MTRSLTTLLCVAIASVALVGTACLATRRMCAEHHSAATDDLAWLRQEFSLRDAELQHVRALHEGYLPTCRSYCSRIEAKTRELQGLLAAAPGVSGDAEQCVRDLGQLRAECQVAMLRHFAEVSAVMPPPQGQRYLAEMRRLTLGRHEQLEHSMAH